MMTFQLEEIMEASNDYAGFCTACGERRETTEPDAREYRCDACGKDAVYGAEELVLMGLVE